MNENFTQQEILLNTEASFSKRNWAENGNEEQTASGREELEKACWNGLFRDLLPEILEKSADGKSLVLWQINEMDCFIQLELSDSPSAQDKMFSINPYSCLAQQQFN